MPPGSYRMLWSWPHHHSVLYKGVCAPWLQWLCGLQRVTYCLLFFLMHLHLMYRNQPDATALFHDMCCIDNFFAQRNSLEH
jgi:hypothetical protein